MNCIGNITAKSSVFLRTIGNDPHRGDADRNVDTQGHRD
jgi:hypothetical protein